MQQYAWHWFCSAQSSDSSSSSSELSSAIKDANIPAACFCLTTWEWAKGQLLIAHYCVEKARCSIWGGSRIWVSRFQGELDLLRRSWFCSRFCSWFCGRRFLGPLSGSRLRLCKGVNGTKSLQNCTRSKQTFVPVSRGAVFLLELAAAAVSVGLAAGFFAAKNKVVCRRQWTQSRPGIACAKDRRGNSDKSAGIFWTRAWLRTSRFALLGVTAMMSRHANACLQAEHNEQVSQGRSFAPPTLHADRWRIWSCAAAPAVAGVVEGRG